ncbi:MAG: glycosyltransferase family 9 protein, partial [Gammaproteobacteria bacterium]
MWLRRDASYTIILLPDFSTRLIITMSLTADRPPESICLLRLSAIGDCCHTLPVVRTIQSAWPSARISWIIGTTEYELMKGLDGVEFITFDKGRGSAARRELKRRLAGRRFSLLLHMQASLRANLLSRIVEAKRRIGFDRARARDFQWLFSNEKIEAHERQHVMDGLFGFAEALGIEDRNMHWDIPLSPADLDFATAAASADARVCVISPCSSQRFRNFRNWSAQNYCEVAQYLAGEYNARIIVSGGNTEMERSYGNAIAEAVGEAALNLVGKTTLKQLLALIARADLLIGPDSGPVHMATAVDTPVL